MDVNGNGVREICIGNGEGAGSGESGVGFYECRGVRVTGLNGDGGSVVGTCDGDGDRLVGGGAGAVGSANGVGEGKDFTGGEVIEGF